MKRLLFYVLIPVMLVYAAINILVILLWAFLSVIFPRIPTRFIYRMADVFDWHGRLGA